MARSRMESHVVVMVFLVSGCAGTANSANGVAPPASDAGMVSRESGDDQVLPSVRVTDAAGLQAPRIDDAGFGPSAAAGSIVDLEVLEPPSKAPASADSTEEPVVDACTGPPCCVVRTDAYPTIRSALLDRRCAEIQIPGGEPYVIGGPDEPFILSAARTVRLVGIDEGFGTAPQIRGPASGGHGQLMSVGQSAEGTAVEIENIRFGPLARSSTYNGRGCLHVSAHSSQQPVRVTLRHLDFHGCQAGSRAGALDLENTITMIEDSMFHENRGTWSGAIVSESTQLSLHRVRGWANTGGFAGFLFSGCDPDMQTGFVRVENSSFVFNVAESSSWGAPALLIRGGATWCAEPLIASIYSSTLAENRQHAIHATSAQVILANSIVTSPNAPSFSCIYGGRVESRSYNLVSPDSSSCFVADETDLGGDDPALEISNEGGFAYLSAGSVAIDGGNPNACLGVDGNPLQIDQLGMPRIVGDRCDIGAIEHLRDSFDSP